MPAHRMKSRREKETIRGVFGTFEQVFTSRSRLCVINATRLKLSNAVKEVVRNAYDPANKRGLAVTKTPLYPGN